MLTNIFNSLFNANTYHRFFYFLGALDSGTLFRNSIELIIFTIISYMIISEFIRSKKNELKYLIIAFVSLMLYKALSVMVYFNIVFGDFNKFFLSAFIPVIDHALDVFTLILLIHAFLYPLYKDKINILKYKVEEQVLFLLFVTIILESIWFITLIDNPFFQPKEFFGNIIFVMIKVGLTCYALYYLAFHDPAIKVKRNMAVFRAFAVYLITPMIQLVNIIIFNSDPRISLFEQPFPILSVLLFTQVIYLKLVDKAYLENRLIISEKKYRVEKELGKMKDEFISNVSHELRTPLTSMKLYLSLLINGTLGKIKKKQKDSLVIIKDESDRLTNLINDILSLSKLESKKEKLNIELFDLNKLNNPIHLHLAKNKNIKVNFNIPNDFKVNVDIDKFKQIYINLMSNAVKFTESGGKINIIAKNLNNYWEFCVCDTGKGIPKDEIPKLFDKFYQIESQMTKSKTGVGLGLAIVKHIVLLHKGEIKVESEPGKGSSFKITIPKKIS